jgi:phosphoglycolate phosphatase-like HAD superfamily hydrolase
MEGFSLPVFPAFPTVLTWTMALRGIIFDIDGTLVDTNPSHVEAWRRAFKDLGFDIPAARIKVEIGKGGDQLVPSILGQAAEERYGEALRRAQKAEFLKIAEREHFRVFPCVPELFQALREREIRTALATSSDKKHLQATMTNAGLDLTRLADVLVTNDDVQVSKPAPDLILVTWEKLAVSPTDCAMVGDTVYDGQACQAAGVVFLGVLSGCSTESALLQAGACGVWRDTGHLYADLDRALEIASLAAAAIE